MHNYNYARLRLPLFTMLGRTWLRLTLLCTLLSGLVVAGFGAYALWLQQGQYKEQRESAFLTAAAGVISKLQADRSVTQEWLMQTETTNNIILYVFDSGYALKYGTDSDDAKRLQLLDAAKAAGKLDLSSAPQIGKAEQSVYEFECESSIYRAFVYKTAEAPPWYSFLALQNKTNEYIAEQNLTRDYIFICSAAIFALFAVSCLFSYVALAPARQTIKKQNEFIAAASHELKSPLAVISASAAALLAKPDEARQMTLNIQNECTRLGALVEDLQTLSAADARAWQIKKSCLEADTLVLNLCESLEPLCKNTGHTLRADIQSADIPELNGDKARIEQIITVLINNAISYSPPCEITVAVKPHGKGVEISVCDNGPGVPDKDKKKIFDRFYRADKSRTDKEHFGLGLSVAKELAHLHGGSLYVKDAESKGACFVLII